MYSREEAAQIKRDFWTRFGQYMRPVPGASGDTINWLNYKTGIRHLFFRLDAGRQQASIGIEIRHPDPYAIPIRNGRRFTLISSKPCRKFSNHIRKKAGTGNCINTMKMANW